MVIFAPSKFIQPSAVTHVTNFLEIRLMIQNGHFFGKGYRPMTKRASVFLACHLLIASLVSGCSLSPTSFAGNSASSDAPPVSQPSLIPAAQHSPQQHVQDIHQLAPAPFIHQPMKPQAAELVAYHGPIEHIFFHPLIAYPELAFDGDAMAKGYNDWFVTVTEFNRILDSLYRKQYVLVDIRDLYTKTIQNGQTKMARKELKLPKNKKPLVLSIDDLNYYDYMLENGNVHKLVVDAEGKIATFSRTPGGEEKIAYDNEIVPIVDEFIRTHPDFSPSGAKGTVALTGYQGVLGYRTHDAVSQQYEREKREALQVIGRMKETGWTFASHGYGHLDAKKVSYKSLAEDTRRWKEEVEPLIGPTPVYIYPYGSRVDTNGAKYKMLVKSGFSVLCGVGPAPYLKVMNDAMMMDRRHIDGISLETQGERLLPLFDSKQVLDSLRHRLEK